MAEDTLYDNLMIGLAFILIGFVPLWVISLFMKTSKKLNLFEKLKKIRNKKEKM